MFIRPSTSGLSVPVSSIGRPPPSVIKIAASQIVQLVSWVTILSNDVFMTVP